MPDNLLFYLTLNTTLWGMYSYLLRFIEEETNSESLSNVAKVTQCLRFQSLI